MIKILIAGANSYIGTCFEQYMNNYNEYEVSTADTIDGKWKNVDFSEFDVVFCVAGLAHANPKPEMRDLYYSVNTDLVVELAEHAKKSGVGQFIFMSSMIVFGSRQNRIDKCTEPKPENFYGDSKLQADIKLHKLCDDEFRVVSLRPPMIYGRGSRGNYPRLASLARKTPIFPNFKNERSMLYIENLCEFIKQMIDNHESGIFYPQNKEYVNTAMLVKTIAMVHDKKMYTTRVFNPLLKALSRKMTVFNKLFGDYTYSKEMSSYNNFDYCVVGFEESIRRTEGIC